MQFLQYYVEFKHKIMTKNRKLLIAILIIATVVLAGVSILISSVINNNNLQSQTGAQTNPILANCNNTTNTCTIPSGVCNPSKVYIHFCNELKRDNEKCISSNPIEIPISPVASGGSVNLNSYLGGVTCGTVQMYLELETSGVNSLGACGTTIKKFNTACTGTTAPVSFPASFPASFPQTGNTNSNTGNNTGTNNNTNNGTTQLAEPQFRITNSYAATCETSGDALIKYTISITNISTVSGTITKVEETFDNTLVTNGITPLNVSNTGTTAGNKITWAESSAARTYTANQTKTVTYELKIPKEKLSTFQNGTNSSTTVTYNTSNTTGNTNTFALLSKHSCAIPTPNTANSTNNNALPNTAIGDGIGLVFIGFIFILIAIITFRFQIGEDIVANLIGTKYRRKN